MENNRKESVFTNRRKMYKDIDDETEQLCRFYEMRRDS